MYACLCSHYCRCVWVYVCVRINGGFHTQCARFHKAVRVCQSGQFSSVQDSMAANIYCWIINPVKATRARVRLTCCVMAKPMTGSPSGMSHVTTAEFAFTAVMVTLTGGDKLSANRGREKIFLSPAVSEAHEASLSAILNTSLIYLRARTRTTLLHEIICLVFCIPNSLVDNLYKY